MSRKGTVKLKYWWGCAHLQRKNGNEKLPKALTAKHKAAQRHSFCGPHIDRLWGGVENLWQDSQHIEGSITHWVYNTLRREDHSAFRHEYGCPVTLPLMPPCLLWVVNLHCLHTHALKTRLWQMLNKHCTLLWIFRKCLRSDFQSTGYWSDMK